MHIVFLIWLIEIPCTVHKKVWPTLPTAAQFFLCNQEIVHLNQQNNIARKVSAIFEAILSDNWPLYTSCIVLTKWSFGRRFRENWRPIYFEKFPLIASLLADLTLILQFLLCNLGAAEANFYKEIAWKNGPLLPTSIEDEIEKVMFELCSLKFQLAWFVPTYSVACFWVKY